MYMSTYMYVHAHLQSPQFKRDGDKEIPEPFAEIARFFTESRLLQRDIKVLLEGVSNQLVLGTVIHPVSASERIGQPRSSLGQLDPFPSPFSYAKFYMKRERRRV